ncbi:MAG: TetR/AcrR family transcriptional regulator [Gammaproteobacteria bacterium]|nr:TetR/AcrR family transcriptional regulator [Gammaproteobacteria bacterium]
MNKSEEKLLRTDIKHSAILQAAKTVFLQQGYAQTSMDAIALEAKVSKRTVYDHFKTKKALFEAILQIHWNKAVKVENTQLKRELNSKQFLKSFAKTFLQFIYQSDTIALFRLLIAESPQFPDLMTRLTQGGKAPFTHTLVTFFRQKKQEGELKIKSPDRAAAYFLGMLKEYHFWPMMMGLHSNAESRQSDLMINEIIEIFMSTFATKM